MSQVDPEGGRIMDAVILNPTDPSRFRSQICQKDLIPQARLIIEGSHDWRIYLITLGITHAISLESAALFFSFLCPGRCHAIRAAVVYDLSQFMRRSGWMMSSYAMNI